MAGISDEAKGERGVTKTNTERVLDYLWSVGSAGATNAQIREATGIEPHQQVFMITRDLMYRGKIRGALPSTS